MSSHLCATMDCSLLAWAKCERCQRPFCFTHAQFLTHEVEHGRSVTIEFAFVCLDCQADAAAEAEWAAWDSATDNAG
jgi:hypothetical protein